MLSGDDRKSTDPSVSPFEPCRADLLRRTAKSRHGPIHNRDRTRLHHDYRDSGHEFHELICFAHLQHGFSNDDDFGCHD